MRNRDDLLHQLDTFCTLIGCTPNDFVVLTGAALCLDNITDEYRDIDLEVSPKVYEEFMNKFGTIKDVVFSLFDMCCDNWNNYNKNSKIKAYGYRLQAPDDMINLKLKAINKYYDSFSKATVDVDKLTLAEVLKSKFEKLKYAYSYRDKHYNSNEV